MKVQLSFDRDTALSREDTELHWLDTMIQGGIDLLLSEGWVLLLYHYLEQSATGRALSCLNWFLPGGCTSSKRSGISQFLPKTPIRLMMDGRGNDLSSQVEFDNFNRQLSPVNRHLASKLVNSGTRRNSQANRSKTGRKFFLKSWRSASASARDMQTNLNGELERLQALKAVNPNIRDEELEVIEAQINELTGYISKAPEFN